MITTDLAGDVYRITLDRPERRNALTPAGLDALARAVEDADAPVISIRGAGSAFCAGADLDVVGDLDREEAAGDSEPPERSPRWSPSCSRGSTARRGAAGSNSR